MIALPAIYGRVIDGNTSRARV